MLFLREKERNLIIHSKIIGDYPDVKHMLELEEKIDKNIADKYLKGKFKYNELFFKKLLKEATAEWNIDLHYKHNNDNNDKKIVCQLCGYIGIEDVRRIVNQFNGNAFILGSTCVKDFEFKNKGELLKIEKEQAKMRRLTQLDQETGVNEILINWKSIYKNAPILIPCRYKQKLSLLVEKLEEQCDIYTKTTNVAINEQDEEVIATVNNLIIEVQHQYKAIDNYLEQTSQSLDVSIAKKYLVDYLYRNQVELFNELEFSGEITWRIATRIKSYEWLKEIITPLNQRLRNYKIKVISIDNQNKYIFQYKHFGAYLVSTSGSFLSELGGLMFKAKEGCSEELIEPDVEYLIKNAVIHANETSVESILYSIPSHVIKANVEEYYLEFNEVFFEPYQERGYRCVPIQEIFKLYKGYMLNNKINEFYNNMNRLIHTGKLYSVSDYKELSRRRNRSMA